MSSHMIRGRQLSRDTEHRKALRRSLVQPVRARQDPHHFAQGQGSAAFAES
jgi:hypothetical protein